MGKSLSAAIAEVSRTFDEGDFILAYDQASSHITRFPESEALKHKGVLALVYAGATDRAARLFNEWGLGKSIDGHVLSLEGRIAKDRALKRSGGERREALFEAAAIYRRIYERSPDYYPAINWASLAFLAGEEGEAARVARTVLADPAIAGATGYWALATRAEANLLLGARAEAIADLEHAVRRPDATIRARSTTRRQLRLILVESAVETKGIAAVLAPLAMPLTLHIHDRSGQARGWEHYSNPAVAKAARKSIRQSMAEVAPGFVFASLATPAEVLFAETALAAGVELTVVLPAPVYSETLAAGADEHWRKRMEKCRRKARAVIFASDDPLSDDPSLGDHAAKVGMGLALHHARHLDGEVAQIVLTDEPANQGMVTSVEEAWTAVEERRRIQLSLPQERRGSSEKYEQRPSCAVVFGDLPGFSRLPEKYVPIFWETVMQAIGDVLDKEDKSVALKNTWGDAIHLVVPDVSKAAEICLAVQKRLAAIDGRMLGRDEAPTMRIGAHYAPVFSGKDPVAGRDTFYGRALSRAARIEPITPPGTVYVTEAFAAILMLESRGEFTCTYVGQVPLAKGFGTFRMYDLAESAKP